MTSKLNPYVSFNGNAREAMEFYKSVFGGTLALSTYGEYPMPGMDDDETNKIMHGMLEAANGITFMGADMPKVMQYDDGQRVTLALNGDDEEILRGYWGKLAEGGRIDMPLEKAPWGDSFGQLTDRYGVQWMVNIAGKKEG